MGKSRCLSVMLTGAVATDELISVSAVPHVWCGSEGYICTCAVNAMPSAFLACFLFKIFSVVYLW